MTGNTTNHLEGISIKDWVFYSLLGLFAVALPASITASTVIQILFAAILSTVLGVILAFSAGRR